jgi:hypothetical protein
MCQLLKLDDSTEWDNLLSRLPKNQRDIFFTPSYHKLFQQHETGTPRCFVFQQGESIALFPFFLRSLDRLNFSPYSNFFDFQGVYGFNGVASNCYNDDFQTNFHSSFRHYCLENDIIAGFIRYHPTIDNVQFSINRLPITEDRKVIILDLSRDYETIWTSQYNSQTRNMIRKGRKTLECKISHGVSEYTSFYEMYKKSMERLSANPFYFFDCSFFEQLSTLPNNQCSIFTAYDETGNRVAGIILLLYEENAHYFLAARNNTITHNAATSFLLDHAIRFAKSAGKRFFHFGGGRTNKTDDSLLKFKKGFGETQNFFLSRLIYNEKIYFELCALWSKQFPNLKKRYEHLHLRYHKYE